jgi:TonB family protein
MNTAIAWSLVVHVALVAALFLVPREWLSRQEQPRTVMTISLAGSPGERTSGTTSIGGRTVEQVAPPPRRPEPVPVTPPAPTPVAPAPARANTPQPTSRPAPARPETQTARPPRTGAQVSEGSTAADTGARGQSQGLTAGGGGLGAVTELSDFCCPEYITALLSRVNTNWKKNQPERGTTIIRFTIRRDGSIDLEGMQVLQSSGNSLLDRTSRNALTDTRQFARLPPQYPNDTLTIRLTFPYGT